MTQLIADAITNAVRAVLNPYINTHIEPSKVDEALNLLTGKKPTNAECEAMSIDEACKRLKCSKQAIHYHCRKGRIRRATIPGTTRSRGLIASDVYAILNGEFSLSPRVMKGGKEVAK